MECMAVELILAQACAMIGGHHDGGQPATSSKRFQQVGHAAIEKLRTIAGGSTGGGGRPWAGLRGEGTSRLASLRRSQA